MTEEEFARYTPGFMAAQDEAEQQRQSFIAQQPCHYTLPVPTEQGKKRVAMHQIMKGFQPTPSRQAQGNNVSAICIMHVLSRPCHDALTQLSKDRCTKNQI